MGHGERRAGRAAPSARYRRATGAPPGRYSSQFARGSGVVTCSVAVPGGGGVAVMNASVKAEVAVAVAVSVAGLGVRLAKVPLRAGPRPIYQGVKPSTPTPRSAGGVRSPASPVIMLAEW